MDYKDLQNLLDSLDEGPLGKSQRYWDNLDKLDIARKIHHSKPLSKETRDKMSRAKR